MPAEVQVVNAALFDILSTDTTIKSYLGNPARIYQAVAPEGVVLPYLRFQVLSALDLNAIAPKRAQTVYVYYLEAVGLGANTTQIGSVMARVDAVLYGTRQTLIGYVLDWLREEQTGPLQTLVTGVVYSAMGQRYRAWLTPV